MKEIYFYSLSEEEKSNQWIPILKVGKVANKYDFNGQQREITAEELQSILTNFKNKVLRQREIPVVESHFGSEKAYGWVKDLKIEGDYLYALIEWNEEGQKVKENKTYRYVSPEIAHNYLDEEGKVYDRVLVRIALTNTPAGDLPPLDTNSMFLYAYSMIDDDGLYEIEPVIDYFEESEREKLRKEAEARSQKWGIRVRADGHLTPPSKYAKEGATDPEDYADPVNYRYPLHTKENCLSALRYFSKAYNRQFYSPEERIIIWGRIIKACLKYGIKPTYDPLLHKDLPESIKKQMEGYTMDVNIDEFIKDVTEHFNNLLQVKTQEIEQLKQELVKLQEQYNNLIKEQEDAKWLQVLDDLVQHGHIVPAMVEELKGIPVELRGTMEKMLRKQKIIDYNSNAPLSNVLIESQEEKEIKQLIEKVREKLGGK